MKKILYALIVFMVFASGAAAADLYNKYTADEVKYTINVDGEKQDFKLPVVSINDSTYISLREWSEKVGYTVDWNGEEKKIDLIGADKTAEPTPEETPVPTPSLEPQKTLPPNSTSQPDAASHTLVDIFDTSGLPSGVADESYEETMFNGASLSKGLKYRYIAKDDFSYKQALKDMHFKAYDDYEAIHDVYQAAELGSAYLDLTWYDDLYDTYVYYDRTEKVWFVYYFLDSIYEHKSEHPEVYAIALDCLTGEVRGIYYYDAYDEKRGDLSLTARDDWAKFRAELYTQTEEMSEQE